MTQTIVVEFADVNIRASQLRAAGAAVQVTKGNTNFTITIIKAPVIATVEEILNYSNPIEIVKVSEDIAAPLEQVKDLPSTVEEIFSTPVKNVEVVDGQSEESLSSSTKKSRKNPTKTKLKQQPKDLSAFADNDNIPF